MSGHMSSNTDHLIRSNLWSREIKDVLEDELMAMRYVRMLPDFTDGTTINIPSIGQAEVQDYVEGNAVTYTALDTGNFTFSVGEYKQSATFITRKMMQDSMYANELMARFAPSQARAIATAMETKILATAPEAQTSGNLNSINGAAHRFIGSGTNETIAINDFARAYHSLQVASVPSTNRVAIVDPSVEFALGTLSSITTVANNPQWEGIVRTGMSTGMRFIANVWGFDVYTSNYLKKSVNETIGSKTTTSGVANLFFSVAPEAVPFVGQIRQQPIVDSEFNKDLQREEYVTTCRYGFGFYRPENMVVVITDTDQVA